MAANILKSSRAIQMSVFVVRAFVRMRQVLIAQRDLAKKLAEIEKKLTERLDVHETAIVEVLRQIMTLLTPPHEPEPPRKQIGFHKEYYSRLLEVSQKGDWGGWIKFFLRGVVRASEEAVADAEKILELHDEYKKKLRRTKKIGVQLS